ncbi:uncharacterized protein LOC144433538 [Glandiceps talaboti]
MANIEKRLYIGGLSDRVQENDLNEKFGKFGQVLSVEIKSRKNDTGETAKTFAYVSMKTTENDLKKCFSVYNNTKWKGHQMVIQTAKEDFISRLKKERQSALAESSEQVTESTLEKNLAAAGVHNFVKKGAVPGTPIPGEKNWVVGKFGRVLPIVHIRRKDKKKIFKYDPSQHSHQLKKLDSQEVTDVSLEDLTWELEDRESRYGKENGNVEEVDMSEDDTGIRKREDEDLSVSGSTGEKIKKGKTKEKRKLLRKEKTPKRVKSSEDVEESDCLILDRTIPDEDVAMVTETACEDVERQTYSDTETFQQTEKEYMSSMSKFYDFKDDFFAREEDLLDRLEYDKSLKERLENMSTVHKDDNDENDSFEVVSENVTPKEMKPKKSKLSESKKRTKTGVDGKDSDVESCGSADTDDICTSVKSVKKKKRIDTDEIKTVPTENDTPETKTKKKKKEKKPKLAKKSDKTEKSDAEISESVSMTPGEGKATIKTKTLEKTTKRRTEKLRESDVDNVKSTNTEDVIESVKSTPSERKSTPKTKTLRMTESMKTGENLDESDFLILDKTVTNKDVTMVTETVCEDVQRQTNSDIEKETFQETEEKLVSSMSKFYDFKDDFFAREEDLLDRLEYDKSLKERLENMSTVHKDDNDENDSLEVVSENVTPKEMKPKKSKLSESKKRTKTGVDGKDSDVESCGSADTDDICTSVKSVKKKKRIDTDEIKTVPTEKDTPETKTKKKKKEKKSKLVKKSDLTEKSDAEISESVTMTPGEGKATIKTKTLEKTTKSRMEKLKESDVDKSTPKTKTLRKTESMKTGESLDESDFLILDKTITDKDVTMVTETVCEDVQRQTNSDIEKETFQETEEKHVSSVSKFYDFKDDFFAREEDLLDRLEYDKSLKERLENMSAIHKDDNDENNSLEVVSENVTPKEMKPKKSKLSESKKRTKTGVDGKDSDVESCGSADTDEICTSVKSVKKKKRIDTDEIKTVPTENDTPETNTKKKKKEKKSKLVKKSDLTEKSDSEISESMTMTPGERKATPKTKTSEKATKSHTEKLEESDVESVGSADTDNICQSVKNVCSNTKNTPSDQKVPPSNQNTSPSNKVDSEENLIERTKDQRRTLDEDLQTPVSKKKDIETPDEANDLAETEVDKPSDAGSTQDDTSDKTQGEENADQADKGKKKKKDKTKEKEKKKIKTKQDKHVLSNQKRLESLREKQESLQKQKMLIKEALASVDSKQSSGKHVFFGSDGEDSADDTGQEEKKSSENADKEPMESDKKEKLKKDGKEKMTLFDSDDDNSDEDGNHSDIDRFEIKAQYEGKSGQKLMKLQERFSRDERFKLDERFLDSDEEDSESDENKTKTDTNDDDGDSTAEMEDYNLAEEKSKEMSILQQVIGTKAFLSTSTTVKKSNFKDITKLHFDPTKKDHEQYETGKKDQKMSEKKADKKEQKEEELPEVSEEKFFEVSENLKEVFDEDKGFSFGFFNDDKDKTIEADVDNNLKEEEPPVSVPLMKAPWQPKVFRYDSSSDDDDEDVDKEIAETMETGTDKSQMKTEEQKVMKSTPKHPTFFFQESDPRLTEGPSLFCRPPNEDELQSKWEELKPTLQNDYRKQHREARRLSRKAANNRRGKKW